MGPTMGDNLPHISEGGEGAQHKHNQPHKKFSLDNTRPATTSNTTRKPRPTSLNTEGFTGMDGVDTSSHVKPSDGFDDEFVHVQGENETVLWSYGYF